MVGAVTALTAGVGTSSTLGAVGLGSKATADAVFTSGVGGVTAVAAGVAKGGKPEPAAVLGGLLGGFVGGAAAPLAAKAVSFLGQTGPVGGVLGKTAANAPDLVGAIKGATFDKLAGWAVGNLSQKRDRDEKEEVLGKANPDDARPDPKPDDNSTASSDGSGGHEGDDDSDR